ncbi:MAG: multi-sensor hybrid histidine kinase [Rickettsiaceae bacterium]|jgi:signal transduction histidine kinase|nr:multi-sensor hybrid histidine kinase [Rickettsiaceae bacterium]
MNNSYFKSLSKLQITSLCISGAGIVSLLILAIDNFFYSSAPDIYIPLYITATVALVYITFQHVRVTFQIRTIEKHEKQKAEEKIAKYTDRLEWAHFEMQKARMEEERANHTKSQFLANMSHEIRTPLNGVIGMTELLLNTKLNEKQKHYASQIYSSGSHLLSIINDILDFSKIEAGEMKSESIQFDLKELADSLKKMFLAMTTDKNIKFKVKYDTKIPKSIIGDPVKIRQILTNLIGNAVKFTESGSVELTLENKHLTEKEVRIVFSVKDTGIGIHEEKKGSLFQKFVQADLSTTRKFGGTGLGLAISKQLVELMDGQIGFESEFGIGSVFWFEITFPISKKPQKKAKRKAVQS